MEFYIHVNTFWEVFQSFLRNIFLFTGNVTLVRIMLPYSICSTVDFPFSEEGIFRSDFNQRRTDIFPALPLINRSLWSPSQRDLHPQLPGSSPLRQQNALSQGQRSSCQERWSVPSWRKMRSVSSWQTSSILYYKCAAKHFLYAGRVGVMAAFHRSVRRSGS